MARHHEIAASPQNMVWGWLDPARPPVATIASGDTVALTSWAAADEAHLPADRSKVDPRHVEALASLERGPHAHMITGPVNVEGAAPGDVLEVEILEAAPADGWGYAAIRPLAGTLPMDFDTAEIFPVTIDRNALSARLPWGLEVELDPFFGIMAVAPPPHWGRCPSMRPRKFGGNMDNKELKPGATLYLPVFNDGALFYAGDGHARQGDGEVCLTAIEVSMTGRFRLTVRKDLDYTFPFAETASHLISIGLDESLDAAARQAVREMIDHVCRRTALTRAEAYALCSITGDLRVTQTVDGEKGCHMLLEKRFLG